MLIINHYTPPLSQTDSRKLALSELWAYLLTQDQLKLPTILAGDFNMSPSDPLTSKLKIAFNLSL